MKARELVESLIQEEEPVWQRHQRRIAVQTLKMNDAGAAVMGGMSKEEAREFLKKVGWSDERIAELEASD